MNTFQLNSKNPKMQNWGSVFDMCNESPRTQLPYFLSWECSHLAQSAYHDKYITTLDNFYLSASSSSQDAQIWLLKGKNMFIMTASHSDWRKGQTDCSRVEISSSLNKQTDVFLSLFSHCWGEETKVFQLWQFSILK